MNSKFARFATAVAVAALVAVPVFAARGSADFSNFVAIGDSYGAGFQSAGLNQNHQVFGWPAIIAKQVGYSICTPASSITEHCFALPLISAPGLPGAAELQLNDIISYPPVIVTPPATGQPLMATFGRPYNDLAVPGYNVADTLTNFGKTGIGQVILRGQAPEVDQALAQHPSFIAIWIGGNDFLGSVTAGTSLGMTSVADFTASYNAMLDKLIAGAPNAGMVVGTLPTNPAGVPFLSTVSRFLINPATKQPVTVGGQPVVLTYDPGSGVATPIPQGSFVTLGASSLLGTGFGIPAALAPAFPQLPNAGKPLPGAVVITPDEFATIQQRILDYNSAIVASATAHNIPVADIRGLFDRVGNGTEFVGPFQITGSFITGGFFSLDGIHPTDIGYTLFANEYIKAINNAYGTHIPLASVADLLANNGATFLTLSGLPPATNEFSISSEAAAALMEMLNQPKTTKRRATHF